jgi:uncharacterized protein (DUF1697 family)
MPRLIAFLRAINVGGHVVKMDVLRKQFEALGFSDVETFIASGNVLFNARTSNLPAIEKKIEIQLKKVLGYEVRTFVRTAADVCAIAEYAPFPPALVASARTVCVGFLAEPLDRASVKTLMSLKTDVDDFHCNGREVYWICQKGQSESTFSNMRFEKQVKASVTFRGVNTVRRLAAKCP